MARTDPQFNVRMPVALKQVIETSAKKNGRSINAEIVYRIQQGYALSSDLSDTSLEKNPREYLSKWLESVIVQTELIKTRLSCDDMAELYSDEDENDGEDKK